MKLLLKILALISLSSLVPVQAHHSFSLHFDMSRQIEIRGTVVDFKLRSPHASMVVDGISYIDGEPQEATTQRWEIESSAAAGLRRMGISQDSFQSGDEITIMANPNREPGYRFVNSSTFIKGEKRFSRADSAPYENVSSGELAQLAGIDRLAGRWSSPGGFGSGMILPLNEKGREAWDSYDAKLSPANTCEPMNFPDMFNAPYLFDLRLEDEAAVLYNQAWEVTRRVPLNGKLVRPRLDGLFGVVRASVEGETLVLESGGYIPSRWGLGSATQKLGGGADMPGSARKTLTERFSVSEDGQTLIYEYTLKDPIYLSQPYIGRHELARIADDTPMYEYKCELEAASMFSRNSNDESLIIGD
ncbi:DUF6152 family protein [Gammaproteobacteria bacterium]|nr:DUF6152 family protein [Gammaproteobacteria bacterium]